MSLDTMDVGPTWVMVGTYTDGSNSGLVVWWDGISVMTTALRPGQSLSGVWWAATQVFAVGAHGTIRWSTDGHVWNRATVPTDAIDFSEVAGHDENAPSRYVAVGSRVVFSDNGHAWWLSGFLPPATLNDVIWTGERFVTVGNAGTVASSTDGVDWTLHDAGTSLDLPRRREWRRQVGRGGRPRNHPGHARRHAALRLRQGAPLRELPDPGQQATDLRLPQP